jgi:predicted ATPase
MRLKTAIIKNFRSLENLTIKFEKTANVIVGPNAIGKTTILEAIRLVKATLAPRTADETQQAFMNLGAISPHNPTRLNYAALARDVSRPIDISVIFELSSNEVQALDTLQPQIANAAVRSSMGNAAIFQGPINLVQYLSSPEGQKALTSANTQISEVLPTIKADSCITLHLTIDPMGGMKGEKLIDQLVFSVLEARLSAHEALFSYFPADRALPTGESNIQIGGADIAAQLQSHNAVPHSKFHRLKPTIINNFILSQENRNKLDHDFKQIFSRVLKDRALGGISINDLGQVSIQIIENNTQRTFDIDGMSSGEKGLILTFLLISRSVAQDGIIMLDEPELHLNPAVCKSILPFLIEEYLIPKNMQAIICSHSPEILGTAFDRAECSLLHIQSPSIISTIYAEDRREVFEALKRLGTSASDALFSAGSIFVEGEHDIEILEEGFNDKLMRYKITQLGGRNNIEREIEELQRAEREGEINTLQCFIFDLDRAPSGLQGTRLIKVQQWKRRCLENYLIDEKVIYDLLSDGHISTKKMDKRGEVQEILKKIALSQLQEEIAKDIYSSMNYEDAGLRSKEILRKSYSEISNVLAKRLVTIKGQMDTFNEEKWKKDFEEKCRVLDATRLNEWEGDWIKLCNGKRFFEDLRRQYEINLPLLKFKKMLIGKMRNEKTESWSLLQSLLSEALAV